MTRASLDDEDEKPLDPAVERVRRKMSRLMLIAGLTLGVGIFAVFAAILYKINAGGATGKPLAPDAATPSLTLAGMGVPEGARLVSTALDAGRAMLTYDTGDGKLLLVVVDMRSGAVVGRLAVGAK
jgi:hypothetical protein